MATKTAVLCVLVAVATLLAPASAVDHWSLCETDSSFLYDYRIVERGCTISCLYLTHSAPEYSEYLNHLLIRNHSLEQSPDCQSSRFPDTGSLCVTVLRAKFDEAIFGKFHPQVGFALVAGGQAIDSHPMHRPSGIAHYGSHVCLANNVGIDETVKLLAVGYRKGKRDNESKITLITTSARSILQEGKNNTIWNHGSMRDNFVSFILTFTA